MDALTFHQMIEERIAIKDAERKAAEERAAAEALEWDLALREAEGIARRNHKRRKAALKGTRKSRETRVVRRAQKSPVASDLHADNENEAGSSRQSTARPATPGFSDSDLRPTRKRRRLVSKTQCYAGHPAQTRTPDSPEQGHSEGQLAPVSVSSEKGKESPHPPREQESQKRKALPDPANEQDKNREDELKRLMMQQWSELRSKFARVVPEVPRPPVQDILKALSDNKNLLYHFPKAGGNNYWPFEETPVADSSAVTSQPSQ